MKTTAGGHAPRDTGSVSCAHCSLPVPGDLIDRADERQYCCAGCRAVFEAIHGLGLGAYYRFRERAPTAVPARTTARDYLAFDEPEFHECFVERRPDGDRVATLYLEGVHCAACIWLLEKMPTVLDGVIASRVEIGRRLLHLVWDDAKVKLSRVASLLDSLGYPSHPYRQGRMDDVHRTESRRHLARIGVAGACAGNAMLISFALYGGMFHGIDPALTSLFRGAGFLLTLIALVWPGSIFLRGALSSIRTRVMHIDLPVALALSVGTAWGGWNALRGAGETYFESLTAVIFLLLVGRFLQFRQQRAAEDAVALLYAVTSPMARLMDEGDAVREVPAESLEPGQRVEVLAGETVPADGRLVRGASVFDLSALTGESEPVSREAGQRVEAGTTNLGARVVVEVVSAGTDTRVGRLMAMVETFARDRSPIVRAADRAAHCFVIVVLALAAVCAAVWLQLDPSRAVEQTITLLIVTCPCALGLATPLAIVAAVGRAARCGILIKGGESLERLAVPGTMLLDKTGTITGGRVELVSWSGESWVEPLVVAVEAQVAHPIARAFLAAFADRSGSALEAQARSISGAGVEGSVAGRQVLIGAPPLVASRVSEVPPSISERLDACAQRALTPVLVAIDGAVVGVAGFGDPERTDAQSTIAELGRLGWRVGLISGDDPRVVAAVAARVGIAPEQAEGGAAPERKAQAARSNGEAVVMVGDGVNDAAALAAASVGVAVSGSAEASLLAADVFLQRDGLSGLVDLVRGARRTLRLIRINLLVSALYNAVAGALALAGLISPIAAAVLMPLSSLSVLTLSYRARTFSAERKRSRPASRRARRPGVQASAATG